MLAHHLCDVQRAAAHSLTKVKRQKLLGHVQIVFHQCWCCCVVDKRLHELRLCAVHGAHLVRATWLVHVNNHRVGHRDMRRSAVLGKHVQALDFVHVCVTNVDLHNVRVRVGADENG